MIKRLNNGIYQRYKIRLLKGKRGGKRKRRKRKKLKRK